jgi:hypothetical protein
MVGSAYGVEKSSSPRNVLAAAVFSVCNLRYHLKATSSDHKTSPVHCEVTFGSLNMLNLGLSVDTSSNSPFDMKGQNMSVGFFGERETSSARPKDFISLFRGSEVNVGRELTGLDKHGFCRLIVRSIVVLRDLILFVVSNVSKCGMVCMWVMNACWHRHLLRCYDRGWPRNSPALATPWTQTSLPSTTIHPVCLRPGQ